MVTVEGLLPNLFWNMQEESLLFHISMAKKIIGFTFSTCTKSKIQKKVTDM
jgi:hypothetical protein